jgi:hypothetical protein
VIADQLVGQSPLEGLDPNLLCRRNASPFHQREHSPDNPREDRWTVRILGSEVGLDPDHPERPEASLQKCPQQPRSERRLDARSRGATRLTSGPVGRDCPDRSRKAPDRAERLRLPAVTIARADRRSAPSSLTRAHLSAARRRLRSGATRTTALPAAAVCRRRSEPCSRYVEKMPRPGLRGLGPGRHEGGQG